MIDVDRMEIEPSAVDVAEPPTRLAGSDRTASLMWVEKYRPRGLEDLLSHGAIVSTLRTLIKNNRLPHLLFHGPPGTGKTSTILACAREMYGAEYRAMVLELNASDDRGIDVVRDQIKSFASTRRIFSSGIKLIVLDEADAMTSQAQMALRRVVEKYAANTRFCFICNYANKIMPALQSRCTKFRFGPLPPGDARPRVEEVARLEGVNLQKDAVDALLELSSGDMRRVLNILQSTHMAVSPAPVTVEALYANTGDPFPGDVEELFKTLMTCDYNAGSSFLRELRREKGVALGDVVGKLADLVPTGQGAKLSDGAKSYLYQQLADIDHRLAVGASEKLNAAALIGAFSFSRSMS